MALRQVMLAIKPQPAITFRQAQARTTCFLLVWPCVVEHSSCRHQRSWLDTLCFQAAAEDILV